MSPPDLTYVNYHRHSCVSNILLTDSAATNEDYARRAAELGHKVLSSCEHGTQGNYRDSMMLEVQYHDMEKQKEINRFLLSLYRKYGIPLIMGTDSHFIYPEDAALREQR